jgi:DNA helicase-2/ATP-dependent DNA helicase PcrA
LTLKNINNRDDAASSEPIFEEQSYLNKTIVIIENIINEVSLEKPVADFQMEQKRMEKIDKYNKATKQPYFGRIDIVEKQTLETLYIGEVGIVKSNMDIVVVDWRADIAKVFYSFNGGNAKVDYMSNNEKHIVNIKRKRQIQIKDKKVVNVIETKTGENKISESLIKGDSKVNTNANKPQSIVHKQNDPLSGILSGKSENHKFKDIIATIQMEQDEIIRLPMDKTIIVQGVAGSGKSSIALHRISYLLYQYRDRLRPDQILILGPNMMFLSYIQSVIPKLDLNGVRQSTFMSWGLEQLVDYKLMVKDPIEKFSKVLEKELSLVEVQDISQFKGSMKFKEVIDKLLDTFEDNVSPRGNFYVNKDYFLDQKTIEAFFIGKKHLPINKRLQELKEYLKGWSRERELKGIEIVRAEFDLIHDKWIEMLPQGSEDRKDVYLTFEKLKEQKVSKIKTEFKFSLDQYLKKIEALNPLQLYTQLFQKEVLLSMDIGLEEDFVEKFSQSYTKEIEYDDLGALIYINSRLNGWKEKLEYIVVDEAQDHSPLELWIINSICKSALILGDVTQNIYAYRGINDWQALFPSVFQKKDIYTMNMETSYRSTYEIMTLANQIISNSKLDLPKINPIMRYGDVPKIEKILHGKDLSENIRQSITMFRQKGYKIVSIVCKDLQQSRNLYDYLQKSGVESIQLIDNPNEELKEQIIVIPSYLSKGLEFDAVIIPNASRERYGSENIIDMKLLYVSVTRAHHELHIFYHGELTPLLGNENYNENNEDTLSNIL